MFGLFFLVVVPLVIFGYARLVWKISTKASGFAKAIIFLVAFGVPLSYPFLYKFSSGNKEFQTLCYSTEGVKILKTIEVDLFSAADFGDGYVVLLEMPYPAFVYGEKSYTRGENFNNDHCKSYCSHSSFSGECSDNRCLIESEIPEGKIYITYTKKHNGADVDGGFNSVLRKSITRLVSKEYGVLAELYDYTYFPYGTGWAKMLGAASGSAPSTDCQRFLKFDYYKIMPPRPEG